MKLTIHEAFNHDQQEGVEVLTCKTCPKVFCFTPTDKAARARALAHAYTHGGVQMPLTTPKAK